MLEESPGQTYGSGGGRNQRLRRLWRLGAHAGAVAVAATTLVGCDAGDVGPEGAATPTIDVVLEDAVAPEAFQAVGEARRAGANSPRGAWVAAPGVTRPERVLVENLETGATAVAALFRAPDGGFQVSEAVADAIGMPDRPARLRITAIRTEARIAERSRWF